MYDKLICIEVKDKGYASLRLKDSVKIIPNPNKSLGTDAATLQLGFHSIL